jgi:4-amino-4-deoxy-L-arabinose transferase-like glycosyltransferase
MSSWYQQGGRWLQQVEQKAERILAFTVLLALLLRVLYVLVAPQVDPVLRRNPLHGDASGYHVLAQNLLAGEGFSWDGESPTSYRVPGYPLFVAAVYLLFGQSTFAVGLVQAVLGALLCLAIFLFARRLFGVPVALLSAAAVAVHPLLIYMTAWVYSETLFLLLLWLALWLWAVSLQQPFSTPRLAATGVLLGLATLVRPEVVIFMPLLLGALLLLKRVEAFRRGLVVLAALLLVLLPWTLRNQAVHGEFVPLTTSAGSNFYAGNNPEANGGSAWAFPVEGMTEVASDQALRAQSLRWIEENPGEALGLLPKKLYRFLSPVALETNSSPFGRAAILFDLLYTPFLLVALLGMWHNWRKPGALAAIVLIVVYVLTALVFYGGTRVSVPIVPALLVFAAVPVTERLAQVAPARARAAQF